MIAKWQNGIRDANRPLAQIFLMSIVATPLEAFLIREQRE